MFKTSYSSRYELDEGLILRAPLPQEPQIINGHHSTVWDVRLDYDEFSLLISGSRRPELYVSHKSRVSPYTSMGSEFLKAIKCGYGWDFTCDMAFCPACNAYPCNEERKKSCPECGERLYISRKNVESAILQATQYCELYEIEVLSMSDRLKSMRAEEEQDFCTSDDPSSLQRDLLNKAVNIVCKANPNCNRDVVFKSNSPEYKFLASLTHTYKAKGCAVAKFLYESQPLKLDIIQEVDSIITLGGTVTAFTQDDSRMVLASDTVHYHLKAGRYEFLYDSSKPGCVCLLVFYSITSPQLARRQNAKAKPSRAWRQKPKTITGTSNLIFGTVTNELLREHGISPFGRCFEVWKTQVPDYRCPGFNSAEYFSQLPDYPTVEQVLEKLLVVYGDFEVNEPVQITQGLLHVKSTFEGSSAKMLVSEILNKFRHETVGSTTSVRVPLECSNVLKTFGVQEEKLQEHFLRSLANDNMTNTRKILDNAVSDSFQKMVTNMAPKSELLSPRIPFKLSADEMSQLRSEFPEYNPNFLQKDLASHAYAAASRVLETFWCIDQLGYKPNMDPTFGGTRNAASIIDVGGNWLSHIVSRRIFIHSCCPILGPYDDLRHSIRCGSASQLQKIVKSGHPSGSLTHAEDRFNRQLDLYNDSLRRGYLFCQNQTQHCHVKSGKLMFVHSIYDMTPEEIADAFEIHEAVTARGTCIFTPRVLIEDEGHIPILEAEFKVDRSKDIITFGFRNDSSLCYEHKFSNYLRFFKESVFTSTSKKTRVYFQLLTLRNGVQFFRIDRAASTYVPRGTLLHRLWVPKHEERMLVTYYDFDVFCRSDRKALKKIKLVVPTRLVEELRTHAVRLTDNNFNPANLFNMASAANTRVIINGVNVSNPQPIPSIQLQQLTHAIYIEAYCNKYNQGMVDKIILDKVKRDRLVREGWTLVNALRGAWNRFKFAVEDYWSSFASLVAFWASHPDVMGIKIEESVKYYEFATIMEAFYQSASHDLDSIYKTMQGEKLYDEDIEILVENASGMLNVEKSNEEEDYTSNSNTPSLTLKEMPKKSLDKFPFEDSYYPENIFLHLDRKRWRRLKSEGLNNTSFPESDVTFEASVVEAFKDQEDPLIWIEAKGKYNVKKENGSIVIDAKVPRENMLNLTKKGTYEKFLKTLRQKLAAQTSNDEIKREATKAQPEAEVLKNEQTKYYFEERYVKRSEQSRGLLPGLFLENNGYTVRNAEKRTIVTLPVLVADDILRLVAWLQKKKPDGNLQSYLAVVNESKFENSPCGPKRYAEEVISQGREIVIRNPISRETKIIQECIFHLGDEPSEASKYVVSKSWPKNFISASSSDPPRDTPRYVDIIYKALGLKWDPYTKALPWYPVPASTPEHQDENFLTVPQVCGLKPEPELKVSETQPEPQVEIVIDEPETPVHERHDGFYSKPEYVAQKCPCEGFREGSMPDGNCFYHSLLKDQKFSEFESPNELKTLMLSLLSSSRHVPEEAKAILRTHFTSLKKPVFADQTVMQYTCDVFKIRICTHVVNDYGNHGRTVFTPHGSDDVDAHICLIHSGLHFDYFRHSSNRSDDEKPEVNTDNDIAARAIVEYGGDIKGAYEGLAPFEKYLFRSFKPKRITGVLDESLRKAIDSSLEYTEYLRVKVAFLENTYKSDMGGCMSNLNLPAVRNSLIKKHKNKQLGIIDSSSGTWLLKPPFDLNWAYAFDGDKFAPREEEKEDESDRRSEMRPAPSVPPKFKSDNRYLILSKDLALMLEPKLYANIHRINWDTFQMPDVGLVQGVPGCGKTTYILRNHNPAKTVTAANGKQRLESYGDLVLTATREAAIDIRSRAETMGYFVTNAQYSTIDSYLINRPNMKFDKVWIDEALMQHAGVIAVICAMTSCKSCRLLGDRAQIPFINRVAGVPLRFHKPDFVKVVEKLDVSYRCPADVAARLSKFYDDGRFFSASKVQKSCFLHRISNLAGVPKAGYDIYLTFTQEDKQKLLTQGYEPVLTVHEAQGKDRDKVCVVRDNHKEKEPIFLSDEHALVALTRHKNELHYYTPVLGDSLGRMISREPTVLDVQRATTLPDSPNKRPMSLVGGGHISLPIAIQPMDWDIPAIRQSSGGVEELQTWFDSVLPGESLVDQTFDQMTVHNSDLDIKLTNCTFTTITDVGCGMPIPAMVPVLNTSLAPLRKRTLRETFLGYYKRNDAVPELQAVTDIPLAVDAMEELFFEAYIADNSFLTQCKFEQINVSSKSIEAWMRGQGQDVLKNVNTSSPIWEREINKYKFSNKRSVKPALDGTATTEYKAAQTIAFLDKDVNAIFCPVFRHASERLMSALHPRFKIFTLCTPEEFADEMSRVMPPKLASTFEALEIDISKYDKSQGELLFEFEIRLYRALGVPEFLLFLWRKMHEDSILKDYDHRFSAKVSYQRKSGDAATFFGNTVVLMAVISCLFDMKDVEFGCFAGDDSLLIGRGLKQDRSRMCADIFNLESKFYTYDSYYFCSKFVVPVNDHVWKLVPDPVKVVDKLGRRDLRDPEHVREYAVALKDLLKVYLDQRIDSPLSCAVTERYKTPFSDHSVCFSAVANLVFSSDITELWHEPTDEKLLNDPSRPRIF